MHKGLVNIVTKTNESKVQSTKLKSSLQSTTTNATSNEKQPAKKADPIVTDRKCEKCGKPMILRSSARGEFLGCSGYPKCRTIVTVTPEEIEQIKKANSKKK